jgi:hypothetical protein
MSRRWLATGMLLLAGCSTPPGPEQGEPGAPPQVTAPSGAEQMLAQTLAGTPLPASLQRDDQRLSYAVRQAGEDEAAPYLAQLDAACDGSSARLIYLDGAQRVYLGSTDGKYAAPTPIPGKYLGVLKQNPAFQQACSSQPPADWRVAHGKGAESLILIDRASLKPNDGVQQFWGAYDEPQLGHDMPYGAPVLQKREHYAVDCGKQSFSLLAAYDIDDRHTVTDGKIFEPPTPEPMASAHPDYRFLFDLVCNKPAQLAQLPAFTARASAPADLKMPGVVPGVLTAIKRLALPVPRKPLKHVVEEGTSSLKGKAGQLHEDKFFEVDKATGQLVLKIRGPGYESSAVTFRGLFALAEMTRFDSDGQSVNSVQQLSGLSFTGNWQQMPVGEKLTYSSVGESSSSVTGSSGKTQRLVRCEVEAEVAATSLHPSLGGSARKLRCSTDGDEYKRIETYYYLSDHGWFFKAAVDPNAFYAEERNIRSVD